MEMSLWQLWKYDIFLQNWLKVIIAPSICSSWKQLISTLSILSWCSSGFKRRMRMIKVGETRTCINSLRFRPHNFQWGCWRVISASPPGPAFFGSDLILYSLHYPLGCLLSHTTCWWLTHGALRVLWLRFWKNGLALVEGSLMDCQEPEGKRESTF